jgi:hypothetical protein
MERRGGEAVDIYSRGESGAIKEEAVPSGVAPAIDANRCFTAGAVADFLIRKGGAEQIKLLDPR